MKKVLFITKAPQGTLGDLTSCVKAIGQLKEQYPDDVQPHLLVVIDPKFQENAKRVIPAGIEYTLMARSQKSYSEIDSPEAEKLLDETDLVVIYPCAHLMVRQTYEYLEKSEKPIIITTEYNPKFSKGQLKDNWGGVEKFPPLTAHYMETGFSTTEKKRLGIFIEPSQTIQPHETLSNIQDEKDHAFRDLLLSSSSGKDDEYFSSHDMYFGYYNNLDMQAENQGADCNVFLDLCISKSQNKAKESGHMKAIDIIMPLRTNSELINAQDLFSGLERYDLKEFRFEFYEKNPDGQMECKLKMGEGDNVVRIMNPFNLNSKTMNLLLKLSDPLCYITGDQSLSEAFSNDKLIIYQVMDWKTSLGSGILEAVENKVGKESALYEFYKLQMAPFKERDGDEFNTQMAKLKDFILSNEEQLLKEMKLFHDAISQDENLGVNFTDTIMAKLTMTQHDRRKELAKNIEGRHTLFLDKIKYGPNSIAYLQLIDSNKALVELTSFNLLHYLINDDPKGSRREVFDYFKANIKLTEEEKQHLFLYEMIAEWNKLQRTSKNDADPYLEIAYKIDKSGQAKISIASGRHSSVIHDLYPQFTHLIDFFKSKGIDIFSEENIIIDEKRPKTFIIVADNGMEMVSSFDADEDSEPQYECREAHIDVDPAVLYSKMKKDLPASRPPSITPSLKIKGTRGSVVSQPPISNDSATDDLKKGPRIT